MTTPIPALEALKRHLEQRSTVARVERILDAALEASPIFEGRETYVPLPLLREVVSELVERERMRDALARIATGTAPPQPHGHYLAHREAVKIAREALA